MPPDSPYTAALRRLHFEVRLLHYEVMNPWIRFFDRLPEVPKERSFVFLFKYKS